MCMLVPAAISPTSWPRAHSQTTNGECVACTSVRTMAATSGDRGESNMPERLDVARLTRHIVADPAGPCNKPGLTVLVQVPEIPVWVSIEREILEPIIVDLIRSAAESITMKGIVEIVLEPDRRI